MSTISSVVVFALWLFAANALQAPTKRVPRSRFSLRANSLATLDPKSTIVVTGMGVVSPCGITVDEFYEFVWGGRSAIGKIDRFDPSPFKCQIGAQIRNFDPKQFYTSKKKVKQNDLSCHYAVAAANQAVQDAGLSQHSGIDPHRFGVILGSAFGGMETFERATLQLHNQGPSSLDPYTVPQILGNTPAAIVAMEAGAKGPNMAVQTACATATHAIGEAIRLMRAGDADCMLAGGTEAPLTPLSFAAFCNLMAMNTQYNDHEHPERASRPFDKDRAGFVMSEGSGVLLLETLEHALRRGAPHIYAQLGGYGASCDAYHITAPDSEGRGLVRALQRCLEDARIDKEDVVYVNAHGTSTQKNDATETLALQSFFGTERPLKVSSIKGATGHSLGAAGGLEAVATVLALHKQRLPPTLHYTTPDPLCALDCVPNIAQELPQGRRRRAAVSQNLGFGGHNGVIVFQEWRE